MCEEYGPYSVVFSDLKDLLDDKDFFWTNRLWIDHIQTNTTIEEIKHAISISEDFRLGDKSLSSGLNILEKAEETENVELLRWLLNQKPKL